MRPLIVLVLVILSVVVARAQTGDHLKCYKVKDPHAKTTYTADLDGLVAEPGCLIKLPAKLVCAPTAKTNVQPTPPGGGPSGTPNFFVCYKIKCPRAVLPALDLTDQFGRRTFIPTGAKMLCAPATPATATTSTVTTTSTTSTISTTTTTTPSPICGVGGSACGSCGDGLCILHCGSPPIGYCASTAAGSCAPSGCQGDSDCPGGKICVGAGAGPSACANPVCCDPCY